jgi:CubicO group peptidase (beta-lactamase class C family)
MTTPRTAFLAAARLALTVPPAIAAAPALTAAERAAAKAAGADPAALARLVEDARRASSRRLLVMRNGKQVLDRRFDGSPDALQPLMHMTAAVSALAVGCLVADRKLATLDAPATDAYPQWRGTPKAAITIRNLVEGGRTGLYDKGRIGSLYARPDPVAYLASCETLGTGGAHDFDSAVLLARVIQRAAGVPVDRYLAHRLFAPLGITTTRWRRDRAGNCDTATGLWLRARDLARLGELFRLEGRWNGRQLVPAAWIRQATARHRDRNIPVDAPSNREGHYLTIGTGYPPGSFAVEVDRKYGYWLADFLGQRLAVHPPTGVVMVRTVPWDGRPVVKNPVQFEFDDVAERTFQVFAPEAR